MKYVASAGAVIFSDGRNMWLVKMQVTAVSKALLRVSKICDAGHAVLFTKTGGKITHNESGQVAKLNRARPVMNP